MGNELREIIQLCLDIDTFASDIYKKLTEFSTDSELISFWNQMHQEEEQHKRFWRELMQLDKNKFLPQVFEDSLQVQNELHSIKDKTMKLFHINSQPSVSQMFLVAYRLEFYLLHPAFGTLFHFARMFDSSFNPEDQYSSHIDSFVEALYKYSTLTPETELLGETLKRLWSENKILTSQTITDDLTRILNKRGFFNLLMPLSHLSQRSGQNIGIMMIDIDNFKKINDQYGHQTGDKVLKKVASTLKTNIRASDILGRYGGEEFIIYLSSIAPDSAFRLAEKLREKVEQGTMDDVSVTISIGLLCTVLEEKVEQHITALINKADSLLLEAKRTGKNRVIAH